MSIILLVVAIILILSFFSLTRIEGPSMFPTLYEDDVLLLRRILPWEEPKVEEVYVYKREGTQLIKRLKNCRRNASTEYRYKCFFVGDNPEQSFDSRNYGFIDWADVKYKAVYNFSGRAING